MINTQKGISNFLILILNDIENENPEEAKLKVIDLINDIECNIWQIKEWKNLQAIRETESEKLERETSEKSFLEANQVTNIVPQHEIQSRKFYHFEFWN